MADSLLLLCQRPKSGVLHRGSGASCPRTRGRWEGGAGGADGSGGGGGGCAGNGAGNLQWGHAAVAGAAGESSLL